MSHWQTGQLQLKCSLNILKKALINVMPEWEKNIHTDEGGHLKAKFHGQNVEESFNLLVDKSGGNIGFKKQEDGTWTIGGEYVPHDLKNKVTGNVMKMKAIAIARQRGYDVLRQTEDDEESITEIKIDSDKARQFLS